MVIKLNDNNESPFSSLFHKMPIYSLQVFSEFEFYSK